MTTNTTNRKPTHRVYLVKGDGKNAKWTEIGAAWEHFNHQGFSLNLDAFPTGGRIVMRAITAKVEGDDVETGETGEAGGQQ